MEIDKIDKIVDLVKIELKKYNNKTIPIEASGRHIHLTEKDIDALFGKGYKLTKLKDLSQKGQYASKERVKVIGKKGVIDNVIILGPSRPNSQLEISITDCRTLGIKPDIRESGDIKNTQGIIIVNEDNIVKLNDGVIVAKNHIHMNEEDSIKLNVKNKQLVKVKVNTKRPLIFEDVLVRVNKDFTLSMHIDYDEANACCFEKDTYGEIL